MKGRLIALLLGACALPAVAQNIKPGLWEMTNNFTSPDGEKDTPFTLMQKQMASMGPEQRKAMERMLAQQGIRMTSDGIQTKVCMTPEEARRGVLPVQQEGDCTIKRSNAVGGKVRFTYVCTNPKSKGEGEATFSGDTGYKMTMRAVASDESGEERTLDMDTRARWLGADCGSVKPAATSRTK